MMGTRSTREAAELLAELDAVTLTRNPATVRSHALDYLAEWLTATGNPDVFRDAIAHARWTWDTRPTAEGGNE